MVLLVAGFVGRWVYGPLGKSADFGWQPVWGLLLGIIPANLFILLAIPNCFSYVELVYRRGQPVLTGILKWMGGFFLLMALPLTWLVFDQTERRTTVLYADGTLGWGTWVALSGLILQVVGLRIEIELIKKGGNKDVT